MAAQILWSISMPKSKLSRDEILTAMSNFDQWKADMNGTVRRWEDNAGFQYAVHHEGKRYPPGMLMSLALGSPSSFPTGEKANKTLRELGFTVVRKSTPKRAVHGTELPTIGVQVASRHPGTRKPKFIFEVDKAYERKEIIGQVVGVDPIPEGGDWFTGYTTVGGASFVFCNIGSAGRTGHDYGNYWDGEELEWSGKAGSHASWPSIRAMIAPDAEVHIFYRNADRDPFMYAGLGRALTIDEEAVPIRIRWAVLPPPVASQSGAGGTTKHMEGGKSTKYVTSFERNPAARKDCLDYHGAVCKVCEFDFFAEYGLLGKGFMHVHHLRPVSLNEGEVMEIDPTEDLVPVCPNCHAMLHRRKPPFTVEELKRLRGAAA